MHPAVDPMTAVLPFAWIVAVASIYGVAWSWLTLALWMWRARKGWAELLGVALVFAAFMVSPVPLPWRWIAASAATGILVSAYARVRVPPSQTGPEARKRAEDRRQAALHLALLTGASLFVIPFIWLVSTSLKEDDEILKYPPVWIPHGQVQVMVDGKPAGLARMKGSGTLVAEIEAQDTTFTVVPYSESVHRAVGSPRRVAVAELDKVKQVQPRWRNYSDALAFLPPETVHGLRYVWNTVLVTVLSIIGTLLSCSLVAFAFARLRWPGRDALFYLMLSTMMLPSAVTLIPVFLIYRSLGWVDTLKPLWVGAFFAAPFNVFLLRQFMLTIPNDLEDAAKIDGCSYFRIYWSVVLPQLKPALAAVTIFTFMGSWNNFMGPLIYISSPERMTLAYALRLFQSSHTSEYGMLMAASTLVMFPVLLVFFFTQRYFIEGVTLTGIKG